MADIPVLITFDVDWAPDFMIAALREQLETAQVPSTWFLTHDSAENQKLISSQLVETGIHPNFYQGSSHGTEQADVLAFCETLVPSAQSIRTHGLYQSSRLHAALIRGGKIRYDSSLFLPRARHIETIRLPYGGGELIRFPFVWEDDVEMGRNDPEWSLEPLLSRMSGDFIILNFHPVHAYLNQPDMNAYETLKQLAPLPELTDQQVRPFVHDGHNGPGAMLRSAVDYVSKQQERFTISSLAATYE